MNEIKHYIEHDYDQSLLDLIELAAFSTDGTKTLLPVIELKTN